MSTLQDPGYPVVYPGIPETRRPGTRRAPLTLLAVLAASSPSTTPHTFLPALRRCIRCDAALHNPPAACEHCPECLGGALAARASAQRKRERKAAARAEQREKSR